MKTQYNPNIPLEYILQEEYEIDETKEYTLDELKPSMRVHTGQLKNILYTYILIANPILINVNDYDMEYAGTIVYIGDTQDASLKEAWNKYTINNKRPCKLYNVENVDLEKFVCPPDTTEDTHENSF